MSKHSFKNAGFLPNLLTTGTLFCGFYALISVVQADYSTAVIYIILASLFDVLDGYTARALNAQSDFGGHYDSLADSIAFGVAPALLIYFWLTKISHIFPENLAPYLTNALPMAYAVCAVIRLARFNVTFSYDKRFFTGLPSPAAALAVCALLSLALDPTIHKLAYLTYYHLFLLAVAILISLLMISRLPFPSFKGLHLSKKLRPFFMVLVLVFIALNVQDFRWILFSALAYVGGVTFWHLLRSISRMSIFNKHNSDSPDD